MYLTNLTINQLINSWHQFPHMTCNEQPNDGDRDPGQSAFFLSQMTLVAVNGFVGSTSGLEIHAKRVIGVFVAHWSEGIALGV